MLGVVRHLDAPVERGARDRQILQAALHEADDFVAARIRPDEIGLALVQREQPVLIGGQLEEVALLLDPLDRRALRAAAHIVLADDGLLLGVIGFVAHRIPAGIDVDIDVAVLLHPVPDRLHRAVMRGLRGADEAVERDVQALVHLLERGRRCASASSAVRHALGLRRSGSSSGRARRCRSGRTRPCRRAAESAPAHRSRSPHRRGRYAACRSDRRSRS